MEQWIIVAFVIAVALVIGYANYQNAKPFRIESTTTLAPEQTLDALQARLARDGWIPGYRDEYRLIMSADKRANLGSTAAIGCISVWLGLLHVVSSSRRLTVQFDVDAIEEGSRVISNGSRSGQGALRYVAERLRELPKS